MMSPARNTCDSAAAVAAAAKTNKQTNKNFAKTSNLNDPTAAALS
jgi:hypothetical protein